MSEAKIPLVLIPGLLLTEGLWDHQIAHLGDVADIHLTMQHAAQDSMGAIAEAILAKAPAEFALAGLSMGGYVAFEIMRQARGRVLKLALLDTSARPDSPESTVRRRGLIELAQKGKFKGVTRRLFPLLIHPDRIHEKPLTDRLMAMAMATGRDGFLRQQRAIMGRVDSRPHLAAIRCPTLVICGRQDQLTPLEHAEEMASGIAAARLTVVEHCGHLPPMEHPEQTTKALRHWLAG